MWLAKDPAKPQLKWLLRRRPASLSSARGSYWYHSLIEWGNVRPQNFPWASGTDPTCGLRPECCDRQYLSCEEWGLHIDTLGDKATGRLARCVLWTKHALTESDEDANLSSDNVSNSHFSDFQFLWTTLLIGCSAALPTSVDTTINPDISCSFV